MLSGLLHVMEVGSRHYFPSFLLFLHLRFYRVIHVGYVLLTEVACLGQSGSREGPRIARDAAAEIVRRMVVAFTIACRVGVSTISETVVIPALC